VLGPTGAERVQVRIETPRGSFVKRRSDGPIDFVSPLPCPFDYGSLPGTRGADGEPCDALVLGGRRPAGTLVETQVLGLVRFVDGGLPDDKLVCGPAGALDGSVTRAAIRAFFVLYALAKRLRGIGAGRGATRFLGLVSGPLGASPRAPEPE